MITVCNFSVQSIYSAPERFFRSIWIYLIISHPHSQEVKVEIKESCKREKMHAWILSPL